MAGQAQQPTSAPSILAQNLAPPAPPQGMAGMIPMGAPAGQMPQRAPMPQPTMQAASGGLAGMYTPEEDFAEGGIVAFDRGGLTVPPGTPFDEDESGLYPEELTGGGTDEQRALAARNVQQSRTELMGMEDEGLSQDDFKKIRQDYMDFTTKNAGPDIYAPANRRLKEREEARGKNVSQGQGLALLAAAGAILEGNTLARGASKAFPVFAQQMGEVQRADIAEQRSIESMQFSLADAQRKERMGDIRGAQAAAETARKEKADANRFRLNKAQALAKLDSDVYRAVNRPAGKGAGAGGLKYQEQILQNNVDYFKSTLKPKPNEAPEAFDARVRKMASDETARALKTSFSTGEIGAVNAETRLAPVEQRVNADVINKLQEFKDGDRAYRAAKRKNDTTEANRLLTLEESRLRNLYQTPAAPAKSTAAPTAAPKPTTATKVVSMADVNATVASSGRTKQEVMDALKANGYTVK